MATRLAPAMPAAGPLSASKRPATPSHDDQKPKLQFSRLQEAICSSGGKMTVAQRAALLESPGIGKFDMKHRLEQDSQKENANENNSTANAFSFWGSANKASGNKVPDFIQRNNKIPRTLKFDSPQKVATPADTQAKPINSINASPIKISMGDQSPDSRKPLTPISSNRHPNTSPFRRMHPSAMQQPSILPQQDTGRESWLPPPPQAVHAEETVMPLPPELMQTEAIGFSLSAAPVGGSGKKRKSSELYELSQTTHNTVDNHSIDAVSFQTAKGEEDMRIADIQGDVIMHYEDQAMDQNVFRSRPEGANPSFENIGVNLTREMQTEPSRNDPAEETVIAEDGIELQCCVLQMHTKRSIEKCVESVIHDVLACKPERSIVGDEEEAIHHMAVDVSRKVSAMVGNMERKSTASTASSASSADGDSSNVHESLDTTGSEPSLTEEEVQRLREEVRRARERKQQLLMQQTPQRSEESPQQPAPHAQEPQPQTPPKDEASPASAHLLARRPLVADDKPVVRDIDAEVRSAKKAAKPIIEPDLQAKLAARNAEVNQGQEDISYAASKIDVEVRSAKKAPKPIIDDDLQAKLAARRRWERMSMAGHSPGADGADGELAMNFAAEDADGCSSTRSLFTPCKVPDAVVVTDKDKMLAEKLAARRKWERENSINKSRSSPAVRRDQGVLRAQPTESPFRVTAWQPEASTEAEAAPATRELLEEEGPAAAEGGEEGAGGGLEDSKLDAKLAKRREWEGGEEAEEGGEQALAPLEEEGTLGKEASLDRSGLSKRSGRSERSEAKSLTDKDANLEAKLAERRQWEQRLSEMSQASIDLDRSLEKGEVAETEPERVLASAILDLKELCATMEHDHTELQHKYVELEAELAKTKEQVRHCASKQQIEQLQQQIRLEIKSLEEQDRSLPPTPASLPADKQPRELPRKVRCGAGQCVIS